MKFEDLDQRIKFVIEKDPTKLISVIFVFDAASPFLENNLSIILNYFTRWNTSAHSDLTKNGEYRVLCDNIQAKVCKYIISDCIALKSILVQQ